MKGDGPEALAARVKREHGVSSSQAKAWIASGKVFVEGARVTQAGYRVSPATPVELRMNAPRPRAPEREVRIVHEDRHIVVIDKPSGISSVPFQSGESGTAMDLIRDAWRRMARKATATPLHVVHRIDKDTSGLLAFAKSKQAERGLAAQFREHSIERQYLCVAHGRVTDGRIESRLVRDRGDGLRGSSRDRAAGKRAVTHVAVVERLEGATLCEIRLETGKTHQIRIHLAEKGHPLVGERVYIRDARDAGAELLPAPRLLLHAATLGFAHPTRGDRLALRAEPPADFQEPLQRLRRR